MTTQPGVALSRGERVTVTIPNERPNCIAPAHPVHVRVLHGVYLGIPAFETTIANVRIGGKIARLPLEYLARPAADGGA
jgi:hypothetical protein